MNKLALEKVKLVAETVSAIASAVDSGLSTIDRIRERLKKKSEEKEALCTDNGSETA